MTNDTHPHRVDDPDGPELVSGEGWTIAMSWIGVKRFPVLNRHRTLRTSRRPYQFAAPDVAPDPPAAPRVDLPAGHGSYVPTSRHPTRHRRASTPHVVRGTRRHRASVRPYQATVPDVRLFREGPNLAE